MDKLTEQKVMDYVVKKYPTTFENKTPIVEERPNHFRVYNHRHGSPLILGKEILNK